MNVGIKWKTLRVADLGRVVTGKTPPTGRTELLGDVYPFITPTDIGDYRDCKPVRHLSEEGRASLRNLLLPAKTVCVTCIASVGKMCMTSSPSFTNQQINSIVVDEEQHDPSFVYYLLKTRVEHLKAIAGGAATPIINKSSFSEVEVTVPDLPTQRHIAGILSAYDDLIENNLRRIKILEQMAQSLYREWFVHFRFPGHEAVKMVDSTMGEIPEGWEVGRLEDVLVLQRGFDLAKAKREVGEIPIYAASGITGYHNETKVKGPGIVTGRSGTIGQVIYIHEDFWPLNTALWVKAFPKSEPLYAYYLLSAIDLKGFNSGAAVPTLNRNDIHSLAALIPPIAIQSKFQDVAGDMLAQARLLTLSNQTLRRTRDLLLPKLLTPISNNV